MKRMKKLMAALLSVIMILSCSVMAQAQPAATPTPTPIPGQGQILSGVTSEGNLPNAVFDGLFPTETADYFKMYLDPHGLIQAAFTASNSTAKSAFGTEASFATGTNIYFRTGTEDNTYSRESRPLEVTNKSSVPVNVKLDISLNKGSATGFKLVDAEADLKEDGKDKDEALMYLAVKGTELDETPVSQAATKPTVTFSDEVKSYFWGYNFEWAADVTEAQKEFLGKALAGKTLPVAVTAAVTTSGSEADGTIAISAPASDIAANNGNYAWDVTKVASTVTSNTGVITISETLKGASKATPVATITVYFDRTAVKGASAVANGNITFSGGYDGNGKVEVNSVIDNHPTAFSMQVTGSGNSETYSYVPDPDIDNEAYPKKSYNLTAAITAGDAWDSVNMTGTAPSTTVKWVVTPVVNPVNPTVKVTEVAVKANDEVKISYTLGKGDATAVRVIALSYVESEKTNSVEIGTADLTDDPTNKVLTLKTPSKLLTATESSIVFLKADGTTVKVPVNVKVAG